MKSKIIKESLEKIFNMIYPVLKPTLVQRFLRFLGFQFPYYRFAEKLNYRGIVDFKVNDTKVLMRSYNTPIDMFIFWFGVFGYWESVQLRLWSFLVKRSSQVLDIGANSGVYSLIAGTSAKNVVHAFEPVPVVKSMLDENISLNKKMNIISYSMVVGEKEGEATLYIPRSGWVDVASTNKEFAEGFAKEGELSEMKVSMVSIDGFVKDISINKDDVILAKIDVEGSELKVLRGMKQTLENQIVVFTAELLNKKVFSEFVSELPEGYVCFAIDEVSRKVHQVSGYKDSVTNYLFTPKGFDLSYEISKFN